MANLCSWLVGLWRGSDGVDSRVDYRAIARLERELGLAQGCGDCTAYGGQEICRGYHVGMPDIPEIEYGVERMTPYGVANWGWKDN